MTEFNFLLWHYLLEHKQKAAADAMRRQHNRNVMYFALHPAGIYKGWGNLNFEQEGVDTKAVRILD
jgi:hypothetical protein